MSTAVTHDPLVAEFMRGFDEINRHISTFPFVESDGEPLDSPWHRDCISLLIESVLFHFRDRTDFYVGGNMFIYFSDEQARKRDYKGPDFFFVKDRPLRPQRRFWITWFEGGRLPDVIIELPSPSTEKEDRTMKFTIYEKTFKTRNYFCYDPYSHKLDGWQLNSETGCYDPLVPNERGWLWSSELKLWVGTWDGEYLRDRTTWLRFYDASGQLVPTKDELAEKHVEVERQHAEAERQRAEAERQRAEAAEAELARLKAQLAQQTQNGGPAA